MSLPTARAEYARSLASVAAVCCLSVLLVPATAADARASVASCNGLVATVVGTESDDTITGTDGADVVAALGGDDVISGLDGNDVICGGGGADTIYGETHTPLPVLYRSGNDTIFGEGGADLIYGDFQNFRSGSTVAAIGASDTIHGGEGADVIYGNVDEITVVGAVSVAVADNVVYGGEGGDIIHAASRTGHIEGTSAVFSGGDDYIDAGEGDDLVFGDLETLTVGREARWSSRGNNDTIHGGVGDDVIYGDVRYGAEALNSVDGGFSDTIDGGGDNDQADGGSGSNTCTNAETTANCGS